MAAAVPARATSEDLLSALLFVTRTIHANNIWKREGKPALCQVPGRPPSKHMILLSHLDTHGIPHIGRAIADIIKSIPEPRPHPIFIEFAQQFETYRDDIYTANCDFIRNSLIFDKNAFPRTMSMLTFDTCFNNTYWNRTPDTAKRPSRYYLLVPDHLATGKLALVDPGYDPRFTTPDITNKRRWWDEASPDVPKYAVGSVESWDDTRRMIETWNGLQQHIGVNMIWASIFKTRIMPGMLSVQHTLDVTVDKTALIWPENGTEDRPRQITAEAGTALDASLLSLSSLSSSSLPPPLPPSLVAATTKPLSSIQEYELWLSPRTPHEKLAHDIELLRSKLLDAVKAHAEAATLDGLDEVVNTSRQQTIDSLRIDRGVLTEEGPRHIVLAGYIMFCTRAAAMVALEGVQSAHGEIARTMSDRFWCSLDHIPCMATTNHSIRPMETELRNSLTAYQRILTMANENITSNKVTWQDAYKRVWGAVVAQDVGRYHCSLLDLITGIIHESKGSIVAGGGGSSDATAVRKAAIDHICTTLKEPFNPNTIRADRINELGAVYLEDYRRINLSRKADREGLLLSVTRMQRHQRDITSSLQLYETRATADVAAFKLGLQRLAPPERLMWEVPEELYANIARFAQPAQTDAYINTITRVVMLPLDRQLENIREACAWITHKAGGGRAVIGTTNFSEFLARIAPVIQLYHMYAGVSKE